MNLSIAPAIFYSVVLYADADKFESVVRFRLVFPKFKGLELVDFSQFLLT